MNFKRIITVMVVLLTSSVAWAGGAKSLQQIIISRNDGTGVTCYNTDRAVTQDVLNGTITLGSSAGGQSFYASGEGKYLARIEIFIFSAANDRTWTMRWGPSSDLTTTYYGEVSILVGPSGVPNGMVGFDFDDTDNPMSASTSYYFGVVEAGDNGDSYVRRDSGGAYADGTRVYAGSAGWNMSTVSSGDDWAFRTYECDTGAPSETILAGTDSEYSSGNAQLNPDALWGHNDVSVGVTAVSSGTIAYGYVYTSALNGGGLGQNAKMVISQVSDGEIVGISDAFDCYRPVGLFKIPFSSGSVTSSTAYNISIVSDATITLPHNGDASSILYDASGSYASIPDPVGSGTTSKGGMVGSMWIVKED